MNTEILVNVATITVSVITIGAFFKRFLENLFTKQAADFHKDILDIRRDILDIRKDVSSLRADFQILKEDSKAQCLRTDKLYEMFVSLLQSQKKTKSEK